MSANEKKGANIPPTGGSGSAKQKTPMWMFVVVGGGFLIVIFIAVTLFGGGGEKQKPKEQKKQTVPTSDSVTSGTRSSGGVSNNNKLERVQMGEGAAVSTQQELRIYADPATNIEMVQTPNGPIPTESIEGRKFIEDFNQMKALSTGDGQTGGAATTQAATNSAALTALREETDAQVRALDEKLNSAYENVDNLQEVVKKQNETIEKMSTQIRSIQPITKSANELAKEFFGKGGERTLASRNNSIKVDSVSGDKAYFTTKDGVTTVLSVGDIVPNTSVKVKKIDEVRNEVIVTD